MATIKEIAELAGVSRGTVDRVLNKRGAVSEATAEKVWEIAKTLEYRPNKAGVALAIKKKKYKIGVILFSEKNPFFDKVMEGVEAKADMLTDYGISIVTRRVEFVAEEQLCAIEELLKEGIRGLLLSPYNHPKVKERIDRLVKDGIPVVTVNTDIEDTERLAYVGSDYYKGGCIAAGLFGMMTEGDIQLAIVTGSSNVLCHSERIRGFCDVLKKSYPRIHIVETVENHDDEFESYTRTQNLLAKYPDLTAVFYSAAGVYGGCRAIEESERSVKVVTFDEVATTLEMLRKGVISATIGQQAYRQGAKSLDILFEYLTSGTKPENERYLVDLTIRIKEDVS